MLLGQSIQLMSFAQNGQGRSEGEIACSLTLLEQEGEQHPRRERRTSGAVNNFIQKTYAILQEKRYESIVSWADSDSIPRTLPVGEQSRSPSAFRIHNVKAFEQIVLPMYFKHSNMSSFVRQLNMYNFHKVRGDKNEYEFEHEKFIRNRSDLLGEIKRKQVDSNACIPSISLIPPVEEQVREVGEGRGKMQGQYQSPDKRESSLAKVSSNDPQAQNARLLQLQQINRNLKKAKQAKTAVLKQLTSANRSLLTHKFNKAIMSALSSKIEAQSNPTSRKSADGDERSDLLSMHSLIEHIMDQSNAKTFQQYLQVTDGLFHLSRAAGYFSGGAGGGDQ